MREEDYWFKKAGICCNPDCNHQLLNAHAGCCPRCGTWQNATEDPGIQMTAKIEFHDQALKEVFYKTQGFKEETNK